MTAPAFNARVLQALAQGEIRLRLRRGSSLAMLLLMVALSWITIPDPASGQALMVFDQTRVLYTSSALALGSAALGTLLFGLGGFYLVRGRMSEDMRSGTCSVIAATAVSNLVLLAGRWLGAVAYLGTLALVFLASVLALHALRGEGAIALHIYLATYALMLLPMLCFAASCAILFDSAAALMGKGGDVLFFVMWTMQFAVLPLLDQPGASPYLLVADLSGLGTAVAAVKPHFGTADFSIGASTFNAALAPVALPAMLWRGEMVALRAMALLAALLPLMLAVPLFHRFSPDRVKLARAQARRSPLAWANAVLRPLGILVRPMFTLAARLPGLPGQVLGEVGLTLMMAPLALAALLVAALGALVIGPALLPGWLMGAVAAWGIVASDISTRDHAAVTEDLTGTAPGGAQARYLRQYLATLVLGGLFAGVVALRWAQLQPLLALALVVGIAALSALASLFGRCSRSARLFLALFLFGLYVAINVRHLPLLDAVGFNGVANAESVLGYAVLGLVALAGGYLWNRRI